MTRAWWCLSSPAALALIVAAVARAQPSESCATNGKPCPPPRWAPVWNLTMSTICQPSSSGYFVPPVDKPWGLVSLDCAWRRLRRWLCSVARAAAGTESCNPRASDQYVCLPVDCNLAGSVAKSIWAKDGLHNGTIEETSRQGCRLIKAASPQTKCFIYHNMELALESMESQRAVMYDASKADFFLQCVATTPSRWCPRLPVGGARWDDMGR